MSASTTPESTTDIVKRLERAHGDLFQDAAEEIKRLRDDNRLLACAYQGWTPDLNTQTHEEVVATEAAIAEAIDRAVPEAIVR